MDGQGEFEQDILVAEVRFLETGFRHEQFIL